MSRSKWKGPFIDENSLKSVKNLKKNHRTAIITRNATILPNFTDKTFKVYNGKKFTEVTVTEEMIGSKFGEFSLTRKKFVFKKKLKK